MQVKELTLSDGRTLGLCEYGDLTGYPIIFNHGCPGSKEQGWATDKVAKDLGARIIAPDRPGIGLSSTLDNRKLLDWPSDIEQVADRLNLDTFSVFGVSGGAPYAVAYAFKLPERVNKIGLVSGLAPLENGLKEGLNWQILAAFNCFESPRLMYVARSILKCVSFYPDLFHGSKLVSGSPTDQKILSRPEIKGMFNLDTKAIFKNGVSALVQDVVLFNKPWEFSLSEINVPAYLWYGCEDKVIPEAMFKYYQDNLPNNFAKRFPNEGHFMCFDHVEEFVAALMP